MHFPWFSTIMHAPPHHPRVHEGAVILHFFENMDGILLTTDVYKIVNTFLEENLKLNYPIQICLQCVIN